MSSKGMLPLAASVAAAGVIAAACSGSAAVHTPAPGVLPARLYMRAHPVPPRPGYVAGIVLAQDADQDVPNPEPSSGWFDWTETVLTATGHIVNIRCGSTGRTCTWRDPRPGTGVIGTYEYIRPSGDAASFNDVRVIKYGAVTS